MVLLKRTRLSRLVSKLRPRRRARIWNDTARQRTRSVAINSPPRQCQGHSCLVWCYRGPDLEQTKSSWQFARFEHGSFLRAARQAECIRVYGQLLRERRGSDSGGGGGCVCGCVSFTVHRLTRATSTSPNHLINSSPSAISYDRRISRASGRHQFSRQQTLNACFMTDHRTNERTRFVLQNTCENVDTCTN